MQLTEKQYKALTQKIYELLMATNISCECGAECTLGMGEMGEARDEAERVADEWMEENGISLNE